jgi:hypothetical protein
MPPFLLAAGLEQPEIYRLLAIPSLPVTSLLITTRLPWVERLALAGEK